MSREELHELLDMVLDIGASSKHHVNLSVSTDVEFGTYANVFIHNTDPNGFSSGAEHIDMTEATKARLNAWKAVFDKEREEDEANKS